MVLVIHRRDLILTLAWVLLNVPKSVASNVGVPMIEDRTVRQLIALRKEPKFIDQFGVIKPEERRRMEPLINDLLDRLIAGIKDHPQVSWVVNQMKPTVEAFYLEETEIREPCVEYLIRTFKILGMKGANGAFQQYYRDL